MKIILEICIINIDINNFISIDLKEYVECGINVIN